LHRRGHSLTVLRTEVGDFLALPPRPAPGPICNLADCTAAELSQSFDIVVAHIGDNPGFHGALPAVMRDVGVVGIFHDAFIGNLALGCLDSDEATIRAVLRQTYGEDNWPRNESFCANMDDAARRRPMLEWLACQTIAAVAHAGHYAPRLSRACPGPTVVIPLAFTVSDLPPLPVPWSRMLVGVVGHANANKRIDQVILAVAASPVLRTCCRIRIIGEATIGERDRLKRLARAARVAPPEVTGWVTDEELRCQLRDVDVLSCLRNPVLEGGSASLVLALSSGRPTLVTDHGCYAEVPADIVLACSPDGEARDVMRHLERLLRDPDRGTAMSQRARAFALRRHSPIAYADLLVPLLQQAILKKPRLQAARQLAGVFFGARRRLASTLTDLGLPLEDASIARAEAVLAGLLNRKEDKALVAHRTSTPNPSARRIPVYQPDLSGNERRYVLECIDSSWISSIGAFIGNFEAAVAVATGAQHAIAVCNGTVALHLALHCLGIGPGDEVIVPTFTYIASVNTIAQTGAVPVFADSRASDWLLDPADVEQRITPRTKAILPVHLYGTACDMQALTGIAARHGLKVIEDCAEALGTTIGGQHVGTFGDIGTFSFFGNKTVTAGEGGMVITADDDLAAHMRMTKGQGQSLTRRYWHEVMGFNYRMTNIEAAIGLAQIERLASVLERKRAIARLYRRLTTSLPVTFQVPDADVITSDWLVSLLLPLGTDRDRLMADMDEQGIDTRPVFHCASAMPVHYRHETFPVAEDIAERGLSLPSYPLLSDEDVARVVDALGGALRAQGMEA